MSHLKIYVENDNNLYSTNGQNYKIVGRIMRFYSPLGGGIKKLFPPDHQINERVSVANE